MTQGKTIRILLVEDNLLTRSGTTVLLETQPDFQVVAEAENGEEAVGAYRAFKPDVVVTDLRMPKMDGVQLIGLLARETPPARALVLTHYEGDEDIFESLKAGALGYLSKETGRQELFTALRTVAQGERYIPINIAGKLAQRVTRPALTNREQQVLERLATGLSNKDVAEDMGLSERTVTMYVSHILQKLDVKSRTEAVVAAMERGLLRKS